MENKCNIIRDLLPLYAEGMVCSDSKHFVEEHLAKCPECRAELEKLREPKPIEANDLTAPLKSIRKKLIAKRIQTAALTAVFVAALLLSLFAALDSPIYFPYTEDLISVKKSGSAGLHISFDECVTDFEYSIFAEPDSDSRKICEITAWTSTLDKHFSSKQGNLSTFIKTDDPYSIVVMYSPNDGNEAVRLYGDMLNSGMITMPRLVLNYYLIIGLAVFAALGIAWLLLYKKPNARKWVGRIALYPLSYIVSHFIVVGAEAVSYSALRDFYLIVFISILLYASALLLINVLRIKKEISDIR